MNDDVANIVAQLQWMANGFEAEGNQREAVGHRSFAIEYPGWVADGQPLPLQAWFAPRVAVGPRPGLPPLYRDRGRVLPHPPGEYWVWYVLELRWRPARLIRGDTGFDSDGRARPEIPVYNRWFFQDPPRSANMELTHAWITYALPRVDDVVPDVVPVDPVSRLPECGVEVSPLF